MHGYNKILTVRKIKEDQACKPMTCGKRTVSAQPGGRSRGKQRGLFANVKL